MTKPLRRYSAACLACALIFAIAADTRADGDGAAASANAAGIPPAPSLQRPIFAADFELGVLENLELERITEPRYLAAWQQLYPDARHPRFMIAALARGGAEASGARYLSVPLLGARALFVTRGAIPLVPEQLLRWSVRARWGASAKGRWG
ncbi:MAG: hypothetical protein L0Z55_12840, partial [Planctomycetes bacterium]|nr:hypothetical protein [Planctomycetota bacterium]